MSSPESLLALYGEAYARGETDPRPYLAQAGEWREELSGMIEDFLLKQEPREWDAAAFSGSRAEAITDAMLPSILLQGEGWSEVLPGLRHRIGMKRGQVVAMLAERLRAKGDDQHEKVAAYYNDMEQGNLGPESVSRPVLESLAGIYHTSAEALRRAGESAAGKPGGGGRVVWARSYEDIDGDLGMSSPAIDFSRVEGHPDRIDRLFTDPSYVD
jgi:hypothetical protein